MSVIRKQGDWIIVHGQYLEGLALTEVEQRLFAGYHIVVEIEDLQ